jgi:class 3 adenylate cyclase
MFPTPTPPPPRVFISYSHDSEAHKAAVRRLADRLRTEGGCDCWIDQYENDDPGMRWPDWMRREITKADKVLLIFTAEYRRRFEGDPSVAGGLGGKWEGAIVTHQIYESGGMQNKFRAILLRDQDGKHDTSCVSADIGGYTRYLPDNPDGFEALVRWLHSEKTITPPPVQVRQKPTTPTAVPKAPPPTTTAKAARIPASIGRAMTAPGIEDGYVLICDVVDFSLRDSEDQRRIVQTLWDFWHASPDPLSGLDLTQDRMRYIAHNDTGDGFLLVCPTCGPDRFLDLAMRLRSYARANRVHLRIAIDAGLFTLLHRPGLDQPRIYGSGPNETVRLLAWCAQQQIVVGETFARRCAAFDGKFRLRFTPALDKDPVEVPAKHDQIKSLRYFLGTNESLGKFQWPRRIALLEEAELHLWDQLGLIGHILVEELAGQSSEGSDRRLDWRVALLAFDPDTANPCLRRVFHPRACSDQNGASGLQGAKKRHATGGSRYPLGKKVRLPAVLAYEERDIHVLHRLPDPAKEPEKYARALGLTPAEINSQSRHARAFIGIPVLNLANEPVLAICVDILDPLVRTTPRGLRESAELIEALSAQTILAAWLLRCAL